VLLLSSMSLIETLDANAAATHAAGLKLLQVHRYAPTDQAHVEWLLGLADLPPDAVVVDLGSGYGEVERLASHIRPDLKWLLVNASAGQHRYATVGQKLLCDMHDLPLEDASVDGVVAFNSVVNGDHVMLLAEAARVLKPGGTFLVSDLCRVSGDDVLLAQLDACAIKHDLFVESARQLGFKLEQTGVPEVVDYFMERTFPLSKPLLVGTEGRVWVFRRTESPPSKLHKIFHRHRKVGLCLSGGKDSLACLHLLRPFWERLTVYWLNTGDAFPETIAMMAKIRSLVPAFKELQGRQPEIVAADGWPSDIVPYRFTSFGNVVHGPSEFKLQSRYDCCWRSMMAPMYEQMVGDGVTCIIRGKRHEEDDNTGLMSGHVDPNGIELQFPIYEWTGSQVREYLKEQDVELPRFYAHGGNHSLDCMHCTAYWEEGHGPYLKVEHPVHFEEWSRRMKLITGAVNEALTKAGV
jgi:3'-phosphoadenosine 5'-phosphosulfate sulfotransferase (PAPS reductase)/FAD synthetase